MIFKKGRLRRNKKKREEERRKENKNIKKLFLFLSLTPFNMSIQTFIFTYIDSGAAIPSVSSEFASTILAQFTRASLAALTFSSSAAITGTKR